MTNSGTAAGDAVLVAFCQLATSQLRPTDLFGRIGGEEFASLLPDTTRQDAIWLAERLRAAFEATCHTVAEATVYRNSQRWRGNLGRCEF